MACKVPFILKESRQPVPCGKCPDCYKRRTSGWSFRLMQEEKISDSAHFITLTYDTKVVPITKNGFMDLSKRHLQLFFKRIRKATKQHGYTITKRIRNKVQHKYSTITPTKKPIKYYAVGEYGGRTNRPHYHIIMFNAQIELIQEAWNMGNVHYGQVSNASVGYTLKYMTKKAKIPMHRNDDRTPEFSLMSKRLGESYLKKKISNGTENTSTTECTSPLKMVKRLRCRATTNKGYTQKLNAKLSELHQQQNNSWKKLATYYNTKAATHNTIETNMNH